jgi:hypothetical protein
MADTGGNSLWADIENIGTDVSNVETQILGPDYSYADGISGPSSLGVGSDGSFSQLGSNASAIAYYVEALITGNPPLGNQYFVNTGGMCAAPDGTLQPRFNYINNMSSGAAALPAAISELGADFNGLIPGVADDIEGLNPLHLFTSLMADSNPPCVCLSCPASNPAGSDAKFVSQSLSADVASSQCQQVDSSVCLANASTTESFSNREDFVSAIPTIVAGLGILYFIFSGR